MPILANCNDRRQDMAARARNSAAAPAAERELIIRRTFDAPRALVFRVWTEPQHLAQWSCPRGFTMTENSGELRVGGAFAACMRSPEGSDHRLRGVYREIDRKSTRLNSSHSQISYAVFCLKKKNDSIATYGSRVEWTRRSSILSSRGLGCRKISSTLLLISTPHWTYRWLQVRPHGGTSCST